MVKVYVAPDPEEPRALYGYGVTDAAYEIGGHWAPSGAVVSLDTGEVIIVAVERVSLSE